MIFKTNHVYQGDCLPLMRQWPDNAFKFVITDPPYGVKRDKGFEGHQGFKGKGQPIARRRFDQDNWDNERPGKQYFDEILRVSEFALIFGGNYFADLLPQGKHWVVWDKKNTMPSFGDAELIWTNIKRNSVKIIEFEYNGLIGKERWRRHSTQKPQKLLAEIIDKYTEPGDLILDPFAGTCTTLAAAKELRRPFVGIELKQKYVDVGNERLRQEVMPL